MDQNVCLNLMKKDPLCASALMKKKSIKVLLKMLAMAYGNQPQPFGGSVL